MYSDCYSEETGVHTRWSRMPWGAFDRNSSCSSFISLASWVSRTSLVTFLPHRSIMTHAPFQTTKMAIIISTLFQSVSCFSLNRRLCISVFDCVLMSARMCWCGGVCQTFGAISAVGSWGAKRSRRAIGPWDSCVSPGACSKHRGHSPVTVWLSLSHTWPSTMPALQRHAVPSGTAGMAACSISWLFAVKMMLSLADLCYGSLVFWSFT